MCIFGSIVLKITTCLPCSRTVMISGPSTCWISKQWGLIVSVQVEYYFEKLGVSMGIFAVLRPHRGRAGGREGLQAIQTVQKEGIPLIRRWSGTMAALLSIPSALTYHKFRGAGPRAPRRASISRAGRPWRSLNLTERLTTRTRNSCKQPIKRQTGCFLVLSTWQSNKNRALPLNNPAGVTNNPTQYPCFCPMTVVPPHHPLPWELATGRRQVVPGRVPSEKRQWQPSFRWQTRPIWATVGSPTPQRHELQCNSITAVHLNRSLRLLCSGGPCWDMSDARDNVINVNNKRREDLCARARRSVRPARARTFSWDGNSLGQCFCFLWYCFSLAMGHKTTEFVSLHSDKKAFKLIYKMSTGFKKTNNEVKLKILK